MLGQRSLATIYRERMAAMPALGNSLVDARVFTAGKSPKMRQRAQFAERAYLAAHQALAARAPRGGPDAAIAAARKVRQEAQIEADVLARKIFQDNRRVR